MQVGIWSRLGAHRCWCTASSEPSANKLPRAAASALIWVRSVLSKSVNTVMTRLGEDALGTLDI